MKTLFFLCFSRFLYPGKCWAFADLFGDGSSSVESNCSGSKDGKYELLTAINDAIAEEIKDLMTKSKEKKILSLIYRTAKHLDSQGVVGISFIFDHVNFDMFKVDEFIMPDASGLCINTICQR